MANSEAYGYEVDSAHDTASGTRKLLHQTYDAVIADLRLGGDEQRGGLEIVELAEFCADIARGRFGLSSAGRRTGLGQIGAMGAAGCPGSSTIGPSSSSAHASDATRKTH